MDWKKISVIAVFISLFYSCGDGNNVKQAVPNNNDSKVVETKVYPSSQKVADFLGSNLLDILSSLDSIESYQISPKKADSTNQVEGYPVIKKLPVLSKDQMELLKSILLDEKTYLFDEVKKSLFIPEYAFLLKSVKGQAVLLICPSSDVLQFIADGKKILEDYDGAEDSKNKLRGLIEDLKK